MERSNLDRCIKKYLYLLPYIVDAELETLPHPIFSPLNSKHLLYFFHIYTTMKFSFYVTQSSQQFVLDRSIEFSKFRITKAIITNNTMGNTKGALYVSLNNLSSGIFIGNDINNSVNDIHYSVQLLAPQGSTINYDRPINDWDYVYDNEETYRTRVIDIRVEEEAILNWTGSSLLMEFEFA